MFEENEKPVIDEITENVEETTEETEEGVEFTDTENKESENIKEPVEEKKYTDKELDEIIARKIARNERKLRREYENKYGRAERVITAGIGKDFNESINDLENFYKSKGIDIPNSPNYNDKDETILANADANEIISSGYDDIVEEIERLASIGKDNLKGRDLKIFMKLAAARKDIEDKRDLASIGVKAEELDADFKDFADKLNPSMSLKEKYEMYTKFKPKAKIETIGSMTTTTPSKEKDYYTPEEVDNLTSEDLDDPKVMAAVEKSMAIWYGKK